MITNKDLKAVNLSATNKDFYQIWEELLETAKKISNRWDPTTTNESDPGIVLLKVLAAVGDKLNYNIDKNILEAFMPSAAQIESMRKLCDMMGYDMKYYRSAKTTVTLTYCGATSSSDIDKKLPEGGLTVPAFTVFKNVDGDVSYVSTASKIIPQSTQTVEIDCIEGQVVQCETDTNNIITLDQLDDENRYFLPETQIAENGIYIYNYNNGNKSEPWTKVSNLNTQQLKTNVFKFGYSAKEGLPYIKFPEDVGQIIGDGFEIYYIRTSGINGNIAANTISDFEIPSLETWANNENYTDSSNFVVTNKNAATNGANIEGINDAYKNFKKTVGTYETLVTCRDYINKIYQLADGTDHPLVSNVIVTDIRDDINRAQVLCTFNEYGLCYDYVKRPNSQEDITNFDLIVYPFKSIYTTSDGLVGKDAYDSSFKLDGSNIEIIKGQLEDQKTISHIFNLPTDSEIACIKNYVKLNARITTTAKVNLVEQELILSNIKEALYKEFNLRKLDFGEEIPFDSILTCIEQSDTRIKNVSLDEPELITKVMLADGTDHYFDETELKIKSETGATEGDGKYLNRILLSNILAGRVELFDYFTDFSSSFSEEKYPSGYKSSTSGEELSTYESIYPDADNTESPYHDKKLVKMTSECIIKLDEITTAAADPIKLESNEVVKFRAPNLVTEVTYPAYVNYFLKLDNSNASTSAASPATMCTLKEWLEGIGSISRWASFANYLANAEDKTHANLIYEYSDDEYNETKFNELLSAVGLNAKMFIKNSEGNFVIVTNFEQTATGEERKRKKLYKVTFDANSFAALNKYIYTVYSSSLSVDLEDKPAAGNIFWKGKQNINKTVGEFIDSYGFIYNSSTRLQSSVNLSDYYVCLERGSDAVAVKLSSKEEFELKPGQYLLINYTESSSDDDDEQIVSNVYYGPGTIIKANFAICDSALEASSGRSYSKLSGFSFTDKGPVSDPEGMFSLGSSEQIEIRNINSITIPSASAASSEYSTYMYWILNNDLVCGDTGILEHVLEDGEYLFIADKNKTGMVYYGSGTGITLHGQDLLIKDIQSVELEKIMDEGIDAIPWQVVGLDRKSKYIDITEYQYVTITEGNKLKKLKLASDVTDSSILDNKWKKVDTTESVIYIVDDSEQTLPKISTSKAYWEARSLLEFNTSPEKYQTLNSRDKIIAHFSSEDKSSSEDVTLEITGLWSNEIERKYIPLAFKTNYEKQASTDSIDTTVVDIDKNTGEAYYKNDFKIAIFKNTPIAISTVTGATETKELMTEHNLGNVWTKLACTKMSAANSKAVLHTNIFGSGSYGMMMVYYVGSAEGANAPYIIASDANGNSIDSGIDYATIFNLRKSDDGTEANSWWTSANMRETSGNKVKSHLRPGINIIKLNSKVTTIEIWPDANKEGTVIFSDIDTIKGINQAIGYYQVYKDISADITLLEDIAKADTNNNFYYNCPLDNGTAIEINVPAGEKLSDAKMLYDYNNIYNKFTISEILSDYLTTGIQIARSSKR